MTSLLRNGVKLVSRFSSKSSPSSCPIGTFKVPTAASPAPAAFYNFSHIPTSSRFGVTGFASDASNSTKAVSPVGKDAFDKLVKKSKVVVFMKGVPEEPKCGFSNAVVQILRMHGVSGYASHDVLADEGIRQGIKEYTSWPTIPQVFINGEFVGGCDIMVQMHQNGDLVKELKKAGITSALVESEATSKK